MVSSKVEPLQLQCMWLGKIWNGEHLPPKAYQTSSSWALVLVSRIWIWTYSGQKDCGWNPYSPCSTARDKLERQQSYAVSQLGREGFSVSFGSAWWTWEHPGRISPSLSNFVVVLGWNFIHRFVFQVYISSCNVWYPQNMPIVFLCSFYI